MNPPRHIAIIGSGSGAFAAALKAAEKGARVTLIESAEVIGGTCVNIGCVPSKVLIRGARIAHLQGHHPIEGIPHYQGAIDRPAMVAQQQALVDTLRQAKYEAVLTNNTRITLLRGKARFVDSETLAIRKDNGTEERLRADRIMIAAGARPAIPDIPGLRETPFWNSTDALVAPEIPRQLVVLGGSAVALELAQAFHHLGSAVTLVARSTLLSREDPEIGGQLQAILEEEGVRVLDHTTPESIHYRDGRFILASHRGEIRGDRLLVATGRQPNTEALALENAGVATDHRGAIVIDDHLRTNVENIYAVGDCTRLPQFVYVAAAAGTHAARNMMGEDAPLDLSILPTVVFTQPQVASVGMNEAQAREQDVEIETRTLGLENVPRALANLDTRGFIKLVAEKESGRLLGYQILADQAGEVIQSAALAIAQGMSVAELADQLFPYLTLAEGLKLAAQTFEKDISQLSCCAG